MSFCSERLFPGAEKSITEERSVMSEELFVKHCSPTLAGLKTANMFTADYSDREEILDAVRTFNRKMSGKGISAIPLRMKNGKAIVYLYRPSRLREDLSDSEAVRVLSSIGYNISSPNRCLIRLMNALESAGDRESFPHEIGFFLGYPAEDVVGFIENRADCAKCVGAWKVYGDAEAAKRKFSLFRKCTRLYCDRWSEGKPIEKLAVRTV